MSKRKDTFVVGEYYHIYNRGNSKQIIFLDEEDYSRFTKYLFLCNSKKNVNFRDDIVGLNIDTFSYKRGETLVAIGAWVLMPNHFHIYLSPRSDLGEKNAVTEFMRKLSTAYASYFNKKYGRTGGLFEGKFKAILVKDDVYAKYLFSYIHLNPVKLIDPEWKEKGIKDQKKAVDFLNLYKWGSYLDYKMTSRKENVILSKRDFPEYFSTSFDFDKEIQEWIEIKVFP